MNFVLCASALRIDPSSETVSLTGMSGIVKNSEMDTIALLLESRLEDEGKAEENQESEKNRVEEERNHNQTLEQVQKNLERYDQEILHMHSPTVINTNRRTAKFELQQALFPAGITADVSCAIPAKERKEGKLAASFGLENAVIDWDVAAHLYTQMAGAGSDPCPSTKSDANTLFFDGKEDSWV